MSSSFRSLRQTEISEGCGGVSEHSTRADVRGGKGAGTIPVTPREGRLLRIIQMVRATEHDVLYLSGFFGAYTRRLLLGRRLGWLGRRLVIVARRNSRPRPLRTEDRKKNAYLTARIAGLDRGVWWQATSSLEEEDIRSLWEAGGTGWQSAPGAKPSYAKEVEAPQEQAKRPEKRPEQLKLYSSAHISRIKNLHVALEVLGRVEGEIDLNVFGRRRTQPISGNVRLRLANCQRT